MSTPARARAAAQTVGEAMITRPHLHPVTLTVSAARAALEDAHVHLLLLVEDGVLRGTLTRGDLEGHDDGGPAFAASRLAGRAVPAEAPLGQVQADLAARGERRQAVVDGEGRLVGLLCLKRSGAGFCSDDGVAARALDRDA